MSTDPLLEPFQLGSLTLKNRIVSTAHEPAYTELSMPKDRYRLYLREKARGGVGLNMMGGSAVVSKDSPAVFGNIDLSTDEVTPWLAAIADDCHAEGAAVMIQLTHLGQRSTSTAGDWLPLVSASRTREPAHRTFTKAMEDFDFERITADFAAAAARVAEAGFDGLEIMHSGHIFDTFFSPWLNEREDEYNGGLLDRARFFLEVLDAVRAAVPADFVLGTRMSVDERREDGMDEADAIELLGCYQQHGIDFLNLNVGMIDNDRRLAEAIPGMGTPSAPWLETCRRIRAAVDLPVIHAARIADVPTARYAVEDGCLDLVGMTRAQLADPHLVRKIEEKREDDIRPCVGANLCLDSIYTSGAATCIHNPASGREETLPQEILPDPASVKKQRIVIVGAGPAGLEAARVTAVRGHEVIVLEANSTYGGQVQVAARSVRRRDLIGIVDWRYQQCTKHGVDFRFDTVAEADEVLALDPDVVIVATGGIPDTDYGLNSKAPINDVWDVMNDQLRKKPAVVVYDDNSAYPALDAVERLVKNGQKVTYVSPERTIGVYVGSMNSPAYLQLFSEYGVQVKLNERLIAATKGPGKQVTMRLRNEYSDIESEQSADALVLDHGTVPSDELYFALKARSRNGGRTDLEKWVAGEPQPVDGGGSSVGSGSDTGSDSGSGSGRDAGFRLYRIGDAVASRTVHAAILEGLRIGIGI